MILAGGKPAGRHTEQHDVFFGIGDSIESTLPQLKLFWPEIAERIHIDAWREVTIVDDHRIDIVDKSDRPFQEPGLFFINLGGYKKGEFEEYHYKMLVVAQDKATALTQAKKAAFFLHNGIDQSHIDDKYGIDVDDYYEIGEILPVSLKEKYRLSIRQTTGAAPDALHIGYLPVGSG
jgi:Domain of Unknown Function (DUF1543)